jgi:excinuclease UvrABC ATPase subunit
MSKSKYFQQGGTMQQDIQQQVIQLVQAAMQGDQKATQTIQQVIQAAKQGDQQAIQLAQMIQQVMEQMKGQTQVAKMGSKLEYIKSLKYAKGGKTCPTCQQGGKPLQTNSVEKPIKKSKEKIEEKACGGKAKKHYFGGIF